MEQESNHREITTLLETGTLKFINQANRSLNSSFRAMMIFMICCFMNTNPIFGEISLPKLISDGMVIQRNAEVKIWGWADINEKVIVHFMDQEYETIADNSGDWQIMLKDLKAGGPHNMTIKGNNTIVLENILIGDVWLCSGQSNMNYRLSGARSIYEQEIAQSSNPQIRYFTIPERYNFTKAQEDVENGNWIEASPETVLNFSAVAYFFADELYRKYGIPIGLIHSSYSGSPAQAWVSKEAIKEFPDYYQEALMYEDPTLIDKIIQEEKSRDETWFTIAKAKDLGYKSLKPWFHPNTKTDNWMSLGVPGLISEQPDGNTRGVFWFKKEIELSDGLLGKNAFLKMGRLVNSDSTFVNGVFVGSTSHQWSPRNYPIPSNLLKAGKNSIVIRVVNHNGRGGFLDGYPYHIEIDGQSVGIDGMWKYKMGAKMEELPGSTHFNWKATGLYNAMITPLVNYAIKGVIWYQGEGNAGKPKEYESLFPCLIKNWRNSWDQGDFPFLFVQLANFMKITDKPTPSNWAMLRDSQRKTLDLANTGMAVAIDIGVAHDVHPMNKKDVGYRLALEAQRVAYKEKNIISAGPLYKSMKIKGNKIVLSFETYGGKLAIRDGEALKHFAIAGSDKHFVWAEAKIKGKNIIVFNSEIKQPVAVRYAWANNPESANLINEEGLPASPFRTDNWEK